jgi:hypothetical protein
MDSKWRVYRVACCIFEQEMERNEGVDAVIMSKLRDTVYLSNSKLVVHDVVRSLTVPTSFESNFDSSLLHRLPVKLNSDSADLDQQQIEIIEMIFMEIEMTRQIVPIPMKKEEGKG